MFCLQFFKLKNFLLNILQVNWNSSSKGSEFIFSSSLGNS